MQQGTTYEYQVVAQNTVGYLDGAGPGGFQEMTVKSISAPLSVLVPVPAIRPSAPTGLVATVQTVTSTTARVRLTFNDTANNETGFVIQRNGVTIATPGPRNLTGSVTYFDTTIQADTSYAYVVYAAIGPVLSDPSNTANVVVPPAPAAPGAVNVVGRAAPGPNQATQARFRLTWTNVASENGYTVQRSTDAAFPTGPLTTVFTAGPNVTSWDPATNLARNTDYYYRVQSFNSYGASAWVNATPSPVRFP